MGTIYQLMFFLAIALLAVTITVFVLAVSLLGRAVRLSVDEQEKAEKVRKKDTENEIKKIQDKLEKAKAEGRFDIADLVESLGRLERKDSAHKWKLRWIRIKPKLLTASWGALIPGAFFLTAIVLSAFALYWVNEASTASIYMWLAVSSMFIGICFVCVTLKVIEGVAITSEETAFVRDVEVLKTSLREFEDEKKPRLQLTFGDIQPPFHLEAESEVAIKFDVALVRGDVARNPVVYFFAPSGFEFLDSPKGPRPTGKLTGYVSTEIELGDIMKPLHRIRSVKFKVPSQPNNYTAGYKLLCEGFSSELQEFEIVVKEQEIPF